MNSWTGVEPGGNVEVTWSFRTVADGTSSPLAPWPGGRAATKSPANGLFLLLTILLAVGRLPLWAALTGDEESGPLVALTVLLGGVGVLTTVNGVLARQADPPGFIDEYRGGACVPLTALCSGICLLSLAAFTFSFIPFVGESLPMLLPSLLPPLPLPTLRIALLLIAPVCGVVHLRGRFSRYPRFLLPVRYRLALQAGVRAEDPMELRRFRALPPPSSDVASPSGSGCSRICCRNGRRTPRPSPLRPPIPPSCARRSGAAGANRSSSSRVPPASPRASPRPSAALRACRDRACRIRRERERRMRRDRTDRERRARCRHDPGGRALRRRAARGWRVRESSGARIAESPSAAAPLRGTLVLREWRLRAPRPTALADVSHAAMLEFPRRVPGARIVHVESLVGPLSHLEHRRIWGLVPLPAAGGSGTAVLVVYEIAVAGEAVAEVTMTIPPRLARARRLLPVPPEPGSYPDPASAPPEPMSLQDLLTLPGSTGLVRLPDSRSARPAVELDVPAAELDEWATARDGAPRERIPAHPDGPR